MHGFFRNNGNNLYQSKCNRSYIKDTLFILLAFNEELFRILGYRKYRIFISGMLAEDTTDHIQHFVIKIIHSRERELSIGPHEQSNHIPTASNSLYQKDETI